MTLYDKLGNRGMLATELFNIGHLALLGGHTGHAAAAFHRSLELAQEVGKSSIIPYDLIGFGQVAAAHQAYEEAALLLSAGEAMVQSHGAVMGAAERPGFEASLRGVRAAMPTDAFDRAWKKGRTISVHEIDQLLDRHVRASGW